MTDTDGAIIWQADFNPKVRTYWLLSGAFILTATIFGIVLLPIWFLVGNYFTAKYLSHMRCTLTEKTLECEERVARAAREDGAAGQDHGRGPQPWAYHAALRSPGPIGGNGRAILPGCAGQAHWNRED